MNHYLILTIGIALGMCLVALMLWLYSNAYKAEHSKSHLSDERLRYINSNASVGGQPR